MELASAELEYSHVYTGGKLMQMVVKTTTTPAGGTATTFTETLNFTYDASGTPLSVKFNGTDYYYVTNIQGDIMAILNTSGSAVVSYTYDAWGKLYSTIGTLADTLGKANPLTYRGYVYDHEIGMFYLQSRYYDPEMGRFINADAFASTGQSLISGNMFAYCCNTPVNHVDPTGMIALGAIAAVTALGAVVGLVSELATGGSWKDAGKAALGGAVEAFTICVWPESVWLFAVYNGLTTMSESGNAGMHPALSYGAGVLVAAGTFGLPGCGDEVADFMIDCTFGFAETLIIDGSVQAMQNNGDYQPNDNGSNQMPKITVPSFSHGGGLRVKTINLFK